MTKLSFIEFYRLAADIAVHNWQNELIKVMENSEPGMSTFLSTHYPRTPQPWDRWERILMQLRMDWIEGKKTELHTFQQEDVHRVRPIIIFDDPLFPGDRNKIQST